MPRNGSGVYGPPAGTAAVPNTPIESAKYNAFVEDISEAMTNSVNVNGTAPFQANQPMGGFKLTNVGAGAAANDSVNLGQTQSNTVAHATVVGGSADAIVATFVPAFSAWTAKMRFRFTATGANTAPDPVINPDGLGNKTIKKLNGVALAPGDIAGAGHVCDCIYDGTNVLLLNFAPIAGDRANVFTTKQTFNAPVVYGRTILADTSTIAWDLSTGGPDYEVTITSNRTLGAFAGGTAGQEGTFYAKQDPTGGWALDLSNPVYDFWGGLIENIARGANDETAYDYKVISAGSMILKRQGATSIGGSGRDFLFQQSAAASATVDFVLTKWLQVYDRFEIDLEDILISSSNAALMFRTSSNGGSSYDAGASDYQWVLQRMRSGDTGVSANNTDDRIEIATTSGSGSGLLNTAPLSGSVFIYNPRAVQPCKIAFAVSYQNGDGVITDVRGSGARNIAADVDAVRFDMSIGTFTSGSFRLYGVRK